MLIYGRVMSNCTGGSSGTFVLVEVVSSVLVLR
jgi:hypothetical protein